MGNPASEWQDLLKVYLAAQFGADDNAHVQISDQDMLATISRIEKFDQESRGDANFAVLEPDKLQVGSVVRLRIGAPRPSLGTFVETFDQFLLSPNAKLSEPKAYFIKQDRLYNGQEPPANTIVRYRAAIALLQVIERVALYLDQQKPELVFFKDTKIPIPIQYNAQNLSLIEPDQVDALSELVSDNVHVEQKEAMLAEAIATLVVSQQPKARFVYVLQNIDELITQVRDGYKLFMSSFSYEKIRGQVEAAQSEYIHRIHKTFVDIQGQILAIPVATVIVATQLKAVDACGGQAIANFAVMCGAWIFTLFVMFACVNQWATLSAIKTDVSRQRTKLQRDYVVVVEQFSGLFSALTSRICYHRIALIVVMAVCISGALFATAAYYSLADFGIFRACIVPLVAGPPGQ